MENMEIYENDITSSEHERYTDLVHVSPTEVYEKYQIGEYAAKCSNLRRNSKISDDNQTTKSKAGARYTRCALIVLVVVIFVSLISSVISIVVISTAMNQFSEKMQSVSIDIGYTNNKTGLYAFSFHIFTTCGNEGYRGPSLSLCRNAYSGISWGMFLTMQELGVQQWKVPESAYYRIATAGAKGGSGHSDTYSGGSGAKVEGTFYLKQGTLLNIVCGQRGSNGTSSEPGGGGGGTFVYEGNVGGNGLLLAAGGGGGGGVNSTRSGNPGLSSKYSYGYNGYTSNSTLGNGGFGYGGRGGKYTTAGAGWRSDGGNMTATNCGNPGTRWLGGHKASSSDGGFGGGGSGCLSHGGGGGGGFTGGAGVSSSITRYWGGGGAGSYNGGIEISSGNNYGDGYIKIEKL